MNTVITIPQPRPATPIEPPAASPAGDCNIAIDPDALGVIRARLHADLPTPHNPYMPSLATAWDRQAAVDVVNDFTRINMREDGFYRRLIPPLSTTEPVDMSPPAAMAILQRQLDPAASTAIARARHPVASLTPAGLTSTLLRELYAMFDQHIAPTLRLEPAALRATRAEFVDRCLNEPAFLNEQRRRAELADRRPVVAAGPSSLPDSHGPVQVPIITIIAAPPTRERSRSIEVD